MAEPVRVGDLLATLPGVAERLAEGRLLAAWRAIAGAAASRSRAESVEDGVLQVAVESSGWLHRLTLEEPVLLERCRAVAAATGLRGIRFRLASPSPPAGRDAGPAGDERTGRAGPSPDAMQTLIDATLAPLGRHPEVAEALGRVLDAEQRGRGEGEVSR